MDSNQSAQQDLAHIRKIMDSRARLLTFSGYSTIGISVLWTGALILLAPDLDQRLAQAPQGLSYATKFLRPELIGLGALFLLCLAVALLFTLREAKMKYETVLNRGGVNVAAGITIFVATGLFFCLALLPVNATLTVSAILVLYGLMIVHVAKFSRFDVLPLGIGCVLLGLFCAWTGKAWLSLLLGFGLLHLMYGIWVELRKRR
jgi:hypothetical protein